MGIILFFVYNTRSADQIGDRVYKLVDMVVENEHEYWEFTYVDYSRWHAVMSPGHVMIEKCEPEQALREENQVGEITCTSHVWKVGEGRSIKCKD